MRYYATRPSLESSTKGPLPWHPVAPGILPTVTASPVPSGCTGTTYRCVGVDKWLRKRPVRAWNAI